MRNVILEDEELAKLKIAMMGFVERVSSAKGSKTPEEVAILPGMVQNLMAMFA